jgi:hypothetical protein
MSAQPAAAIHHRDASAFCSRCGMLCISSKAHTTVRSLPLDWHKALDALPLVVMQVALR